MIDKTKSQLMEIAEIALLVTLIVIRVLISSDENTWISLLNYLGLIIAVVSLYLEIHEEYSSYRKLDLVTGVFAVLLIILVVLAGLILTEIIVLNTKCNDIILLLTLLVALPARFYKRLIARAITE